MLHPVPGADAEGMVFTTAHADHTTGVWVNLRFDAAAGIAEYVVLEPEMRVTEISIHLQGESREQTTARVTYTWTGLSARGNEEVALQEARFSGWLAEWEARINAVLAATP